MLFRTRSQDSMQKRKSCRSISTGSLRYDRAVTIAFATCPAITRTSAAVPGLGRPFGARFCSSFFVSLKIAP